MPGNVRLKPTLVGALLLLSTACSSVAPVGAPPPTSGTTSGGAAGGGKLVIAFASDMTADAKTLDPNLINGGTNVHSVYEAMFDEIVYQDPKTGTVVPGLAQSWDTSADGKVYTFHLNPNAKFWDGTPVTADDVKFSLDRAIDKQFRPDNAYQSALAFNYDHSEIIDPHTLQINLKQLQASFLATVLARDYFSIVSKAYVEKVGVKQFGTAPMGSGAFKFVEWVPGDHITVARNPDYTWGPAFFANAGKPASVSQIVFQFVLDDSTRLAALESGQVNAIQQVPPFDLANLQNNSQFKVLPTEKNGLTAGLSLQVQRPPTDDLAVRRAIALGIDRDRLNKNAYGGVESPGYYVVAQRMGQFVNTDAAWPKYDPNKAKQTLDEDGWHVGSDGIRVKNGQRLSLITPVQPELQQALTEIQTQLKDIGIEVALQPGSSAEVSSIFSSSGEYNLGQQSERGFPGAEPSLLYQLFDSKNMPPNGNNDWSRDNLPELDQALEAGDTTLDVAQRKAAYDKAQVLIRDNVFYVPLLSFNLNLAVVQGVDGLMPDVRGNYVFFNDVTLDKSIQGKWHE